MLEQSVRAVYTAARMDAASACGASIMRNATNSEAGQDEFGKQRRNAVSEYLQLRSCWRHPWPHLFLLPARLAALGYKYLRWKQAQGKTPPRWLCAAACMKNEASYIEEWLRYHLLVGVEHFYLYNNNSEDEIEEVLRPWIECGLVTYTVWPGRHQQFAMYRHALKKAAPETRWLAFIDIDEFIQVLDGRKLSDFLREYGEASQLVIMWQHFGSNGRLKRDEGFVIERFTRREEGTCHVGKAITRPAAALDTLVHYCLVFGRSVDEDHLPLESFTPPQEFGLANPGEPLRRQIAGRIRPEEIAGVCDSRLVFGRLLSASRSERSRGRIHAPLCRTDQNGDLREWRLCRCGSGYGRLKSRRFDAIASAQAAGLLRGRAVKRRTPLRKAGDENAKSRPANKAERQTAANVRMELRPERRSEPCGSWS